MADITASMVKDLREATGAGMMDCKKALEETGGDMDAAADKLRVKGLAKAAKKADRVASEGAVAVAVRDEGAGMTGAVIELNAETDFVARNDSFQAAARKIARAALDVAGDVEALRGAKTEGGESVGDLVTGLVATIGENMLLRRSGRLAVSQGVVGWYVHPTGDLGRIGVIVAIEGGGDKAALAEVGRKVAMHISHANPLSLTAESLDPAAVERERAIFREQALASGKPPQVVDKMIEGRIRKFYEEVVLLKQPFIMNQDQTIEQLLAETSKAQGSPAKITGFLRLALGEGVDKKTDDFAAEVAALSGAS
ncbi:MAG: elongation factor Ts [Caulobacteraceae bacterium]|nr:elongation factor Ts [Caulobacteraceae bacterium]